MIWMVSIMNFIVQPATILVAFVIADGVRFGIFQFCLTEMKGMKPMCVPDEVIVKFSEDGVVFIKNCFGAEWTGKLKKGLEKNLKAP